MADETVEELRARVASLEVELRQTRICAMGRYCSGHGFVHGAEAEELREKLEPFAADNTDIERVLRTVDARDSLAYLEIQARVDQEEEA